MPEWMRHMLEPSGDDWHGVARVIMREAQELYGRSNDIELTALADRVRRHFLDRWYRFAPFGVTSRRDLEPITVETTMSSIENDGQTTMARMLRVSYAGTPLRG